ncbi:MAG TPA: isochorismate synthase [Actinomycetota bacterium]|nr:isochorismate synthase [Actinomycetota bacterium]
MKRLVVRTEASDLPEDLTAALGRPEGCAWINGGDGLVGWGEAVRIAVAGPARFEEARRHFADLVEAAEVHDEVKVAGTGPVAFGAFTFDPANQGSALVVPAIVVGRRGGVSWRTTIAEAEAAVPEASNDRVRYAGSSLPDARWLEAVDEAAAAVRSGAIEKVVLARDVKVWTKRPLDLRPVLRRLAAAYPECYTFAFEGLVGASPELLARRMDDTVESVVLAGTARRGTTVEEDAALGEDLLASAKDVAEHRPVSDEVRRVLEDITESLDVSAAPFLLRLANAQHLATSFAGRLSQPRDALEIAAMLHPTPAVCGTPTDRALEMIGALEAMDRDLYAGPVGWVDGRGDGEWAVALRCARFRGSRGRLFAGAGIVAASRPEAELEETRLKLRAMQDALDVA